MSSTKTQWMNNSKKPASYVTSSGSSAIVRLVEDPEVTKSLEFDEISIFDSNDGTDTIADYPLFENIGISYPMIRINDAIIAESDIKDFSISSSGFIPTISLTLSFSNTEFITRNLPKDGDMISTYIAVNTSSLNYLRNDFIITSCSSSIAGSNQSNKVYLQGKMFIPKFDSIQNVFGFIGTSRELFKEVAKKFKIGFSYNDSEDTDDYMNWICCKQTIESFLEEVTTHIWKNGETFFKSWVDLYYDLCFVNVNKFLLSSENSEEDIDVTFKTTTVAFNEAKNDENKDKNINILKVFSNDMAWKGTPFFIRKWRPINNSASISFNTGYESDSYVFAHNQSLYNNDSSTCFDISKNVPAYDKNKLSDHIILRGRGKWEKGVNPDDDLKRVNYDFVNTYNDTIWSGVNYIISEEDKNIKDNTQWSGNVHKNYAHAPYHNNINIKELDKIYIEIECDGLCLQVMRGERIPVYIIYLNKLDNYINNADKNDDVNSQTNKFYSGFYIVDSISYNYKKREDAYSNFTTTMVLKRREWPTPEPVQGEKLMDDSKEIETTNGSNI